MGEGHTDRLAKRRDCFVKAACTLFIEDGYENTTLADVVARAGGSLATLYKLFGNKEGLLMAVIGEVTESGAGIVADVRAARICPVETLREIGQRLHHKFMQREKMALARIAITQSLKSPETAKNFYDVTALRTGNALAALFDHWREQGIRFEGDPQELGATFLALLVYDFQIQAISGCLKGDTDPQIVDRRVSLFIAGIGLAENRRDAPGAPPSTAQ